MSHFKAKMHQIRFLASVCSSLCSFARLCLRCSLTLTDFDKRSVVICFHAALQFYRRTDDVSNDMEEMDTEFQQQASASKKKAADAEKTVAAEGGGDGAGVKGAGGDGGSSFTLAKLLSTSELRRPLLVACMLQVAQQFSGINAVRIFVMLKLSAPRNETETKLFLNCFVSVSFSCADSLMAMIW